MSTAGGGGRISLLGMEIDRLTHAEAVEAIASEPGRGLVLTPNLHHLSRFRDSPEVREAYERAPLVLADGMPLVWASRIQRTPLPGRVAGSDLIWSLTRELARRGKSVYLVGGADDTAERSARALATDAPGLVVAGWVVPELGFEDQAAVIESLAATIAAARPDVAFIGLPLDKQLILAEAIRRRAPQCWVIGVGVSFSFVAGDLRRAPRLMQRLGLEWISRLIQEPRRLGRRYLLEGVPLAVRLLAGSVLRRYRPERR